MTAINLYTATYPQNVVLRNNKDLTNCKIKEIDLPAAKCFHFFPFSRTRQSKGEVCYSPLSQEVAIVHNVKVDKDFRNRGIASLLMEKLILKTREEGYKSLILSVDKKNEYALRLYNKFGFKIIPQTAYDFNDVRLPRTEDVYWMELKLKNFDATAGKSGINAPIPNPPNKSLIFEYYPCLSYVILVGWVGNPTLNYEGNAHEHQIYQNAGPWQ